MISDRYIYRGHNGLEGAMALNSEERKRERRAGGTKYLYPERKIRDHHLHDEAATLRGAQYREISCHLE